MACAEASSEIIYQMKATRPAAPMPEVGGTPVEVRRKVITKVECLWGLGLGVHEQAVLRPRPGGQTTRMPARKQVQLQYTLLL